MLLSVTKFAEICYSGPRRLTEFTNGLERTKAPLFCGGHPLHYSALLYLWSLAGSPQVVRKQPASLRAPGMQSSWPGWGPASGLEPIPAMGEEGVLIERSSLGSAPAGQGGA